VALPVNTGAGAVETALKAARMNLTSARAVCAGLLQHGGLSKDTHELVVRFAPRLVITRGPMAWALPRIAAALEQTRRADAA